MGSYTYYHISTLPRLHHIVWCCVPEIMEDGELKLGTAVRPSLVRGSKRDPTTGRGALLVSYGNQMLKINERGHIDLIIQNAERLDQLELPTAIRFDLGLWNWLPWAYEFFRPPAHSVYMVAGPLSESEMARLRAGLRRRGATAL